MTNELEKQFFDTFNLTKYKLVSKYNKLLTYGPFDTLEDTKTVAKGLMDGFIIEEVYPQITDTHYLKLISIMSKELSMIVNLLSEDIQELKSEILDKCIRNYHRHKEAFSEAHREYADDFKHQVRTLFKES